MELTRVTRLLDSLIALVEGKLEQPPPDPEAFDVVLRLFIPAPVVAFPQDGGFLDTFIPDALYGLLRGDGRSFQRSAGTHRVQLKLRLSPDPSRSTPFVGAPEVSWGETQAFRANDGQHVPARPGWWWELKSGAAPFFSKTHEVDQGSVQASAQLIPDMAQWRVRLEISAGIPLEGFQGAAAPSIHAALTLDIRQGVRHATGEPSTMVWLWGQHDGFPAYELYIDDRVLYRYSPESRPAAGPWNLFPPMDVSVSTPSSALSSEGGFRPVLDLDTAAS